VVLSFTRRSFNYFVSEAAFNYILDAVHLVADHGWSMLPLYRFDPGTGLWRHRHAPTPDSVLGLRDALAVVGVARLATAPETVPSAQLEAARRIVAAVEADPPAGAFLDEALSEELERIRWFPLPGEGLVQRRELTT
jgi:hypothetical protein